jgi:hypothetical protein
VRQIHTDNFFRLDKFICRLDPGTVLDVAVIEEPAAAEAEGAWQHWLTGLLG